MPELPDPVNRMHRNAFVGRCARAALSCAAFVLSAGAATRAAHPQQAGRSLAVRPLAYTRVVLPNGFTALFNEDHSSPVVGVAVWYHIGAKDEPSGNTGLAHLCEHMMFEGSPHVAPGEFMAILRAGGGTSVRWAETSEDRTLYYETVPSNLLETTLWLEADRMSAPFTATDSTRLPADLGVIRNERLQYRENPPYGLADPKTLDVLYGTEHPYRDPAGPMDDLNRATFSQMRQFCSPYYVPNNAIVALSGDFETAKARAMIERYFGSIKRGAEPAHPEIRAVSMSSDRRIAFEDPRAREVRLRLAWPGAGFANPDKLALVALASVLQGNAGSGLVKALVNDRQLATFVGVAHLDVEKGGVFQIDIAPRGDTPLGVIEDVVDSLVRVVRETKPTDRALRRFKNANAVIATTSLQSRVLRADTLAQGEGWARDPIAYARQVDATERLTPDDIQRVAQKYLGPGHMVMSMVPAGKLELVSKPERPYEKAGPVASGGAKR